MTDTERAQRNGETDVVIAAVRSGDSRDFADLAERHRRELRVHCYRMLGNLDDADDVVQDTLLRAWANRACFEGRSTFRAWLYRIATNACLDTIKRRRRRVPVADRLDRRPAYDELPWLQPMPDRLAAGVSALDPETAIINQEAIELALLASIQYLSPRQRAVLILRDLLGWTPAEIGDTLGHSTSAVNSLLQRARTRMGRLGHEAGLTRRRASPPTPEERALLHQYIDAHARADAAAVVALLAADVRFTMPPLEARYDGLAAVAAFFERLLGPDSPGAWRLLPTAANGHLAALNYVRRAGEPEYRPITIDLLRVDDGSIVEIVTFDADADAAGVFGLPASLPIAPG